MSKILDLILVKFFLKFYYFPHIAGGKLLSLTKDQEFKLENYNDCLRIIMCSIPTSQCYLGECSHCPRTEVLREFSIQIMEDHAIDNVIYSQWIAIPRTSLEKFYHCSSEFVDNFCEKITALLPHDFIAKQQAAFLRSLKNSLPDNEFIVICNFAAKLRIYSSECSAWISLE